MSFGQRLSEERKLKNLTQEQVGKELGVALGTVSRWEKDQSPMPSDKISALIALDFDTSYIITGVRSPFGEHMSRFLSEMKSRYPEIYNYGKNGKPTEEEERMHLYWLEAQTARRELAELKEKVSAGGHQEKTKTNNNNDLVFLTSAGGHSAPLKTIEVAPNTYVDADDYAWVPLYNVRVSAGDGRFTDRENIITWLSMTKYSLRSKGLVAKDLGAVIVQGDSMHDTLHPDDCIFIDFTKRHPDGGIFVLRVGEAYHVKRLIMTKDTISVISDNPLYDSWALSADDDFEIIGKYAWHGRYAG